MGINNKKSLFFSLCSPFFSYLCTCIAIQAETDMNDIKQIAQRLKGLREIFDIPVEKMAEVCETTVEHYRRIESGESDPGVYRLTRISKQSGI